MFNTDDTICAIASAAGQAQRGIVRISGPAAADCLESILLDSSELSTVDQPTVLRSKIQIDGFSVFDAQLYYWPDHRSYTREPSVEIHLPGAAPLLQATLNQLCQESTGPVRIAEPGEFTMRAFLAGRLDLTQA